MAKKIRVSYRVEPDVKQALIDIARRRSMSETEVLEIAVKLLKGDESPLDTLYPESTQQKEIPT